MKYKLLIQCMSFIVCSSVYSDIAIALRNSSLILKCGETEINATTVLEAGSLVQILWSPSATGYQSENVGLDLRRAGEVVLKTFSAERTGGRFGDGKAYVFNDSNVATDINSGYVWARIWESSGGYGQYFLEAGLLSPALKEYNAFNPSSIYLEEVISSSVTTIGIENGYLNGPAIEVFGTYAIPEPASLSLMLTAAGTGFFIRRKFRR